MSSEEQRARWDLKYEQGLPSLTEPDPFFISAYDEFVSPFFPKGGVALDLAGGIGRHGLWLVKRQWQVSVVDVSEAAIQNSARRLFKKISNSTFSWRMLPTTSLNLNDSI